MKKYALFIFSCVVFIVFLAFNSVANPKPNCSDLRCIYQYVKYSGDGSICEDDIVLRHDFPYNNSPARDWCYWFAGEKSRNKTYCEKIQSETLGRFPTLTGYEPEPVGIYLYLNENHKKSCFFLAKPELNTFWIKYYTSNFLFLLVLLGISIAVLYFIERYYSNTKFKMKEFFIYFLFTITLLYTIYPFLYIVIGEIFGDMDFFILLLFLVISFFIFTSVKKIHIKTITSIFSLKGKSKKLLAERYGNIVLPCAITTGMLSFICLWVVTSFLAVNSTVYIQSGIDFPYGEIAKTLYSFSLILVIIIGGVILNISQFFALKKIVQDEKIKILRKSISSFIILCMAIFVRLLILFGITFFALLVL